MSTDKCNKYLAYNNSVRVVVCDTTDMIKKAREIHNLSNTATVALGRTLSIGCIMSSMLGEKKDRLTIQISGDGPLGSIIVCGNADLKIKGYVSNPETEFKTVNGKYNISGAIGKGTLSVIKDIGGDVPYIGKCNLTTSEIAEDFASYYAISEQTPSVVSLGVNLDKDGNVLKSGGYLIQPLPDCDDYIIDILEKINLKIKSVTNMMMDLNDLNEVAKCITGDNSVKEVELRTPCYKCDCNDIKISNAILAIGYDEVIKILDENSGKVEITCDFCDKKYLYDKEKIDNIFSKSKEK